MMIGPIAFICVGTVGSSRSCSAMARKSCTSTSTWASARDYTGYGAAFAGDGDSAATAQFSSGTILGRDIAQTGSQTYFLQYSHSLFYHVLGFLSGTLPCTLACIVQHKRNEYR